ncbi:iron chaperone [Anatilimnocola sp. NA78]|uniref:iron chaperone n=1 Tax=Anatilimnocola sp. NA78 TaxID=3415683 RepID=UPI003CE46ED4
MAKTKVASKLKSPAKVKIKATTVDEYLASVSPDQRVALEKLRRAIRAAAPQAEECISYGVPAFKQSGMLASFGATAKHCALYVMSSSVLAGFEDELVGYDTSTGTIRFPANKPLPATLVKKIVKARLAANVASKSAKEK